MKSRIRTIIIHQLTAAYVLLLIVLEVLVFVLFSLETASGLYISVAAIWVLVPVLVYVVMRAVQNKIRNTGRAALASLVFFVALGGGAAYGFVYAFNHHTTTGDFVSEA